MVNRLLKTIYITSCVACKRLNAKQGFGEDFYRYQRNYQKSRRNTHGRWRRRKSYSYPRNIT